jgi:hypothetical protein
MTAFTFSDVAFVRQPAGGGPSFAASYLNLTIDSDEFEHPKVFNGVSVGDADSTRVIYAVLYWRSFSTSDSLSLSVNGGSGISPDQAIRAGGARQIAVFPVPLASGTTADFSFTNGDETFLATALSLIRVVGAHTVAYATNSTTGTNTLPLSINTNAGDTIFCAWARNSGNGGAEYTPPSGFTEHFDQYIAPSSGIPQPSTLSSGTAAGASPETFTTTGAGNADADGLLIRLRAS